MERKCQNNVKDQFFLLSFIFSFVASPNHTNRISPHSPFPLILSAWGACPMLTLNFPLLVYNPKKIPNNDFTLEIREEIKRVSWLCGFPMTRGRHRKDLFQKLDSKRLSSWSNQKTQGKSSRSPSLFCPHALFLLPPRPKGPPRLKNPWRISSRWLPPSRPTPTDAALVAEFLENRTKTPVHYSFRTGVKIIIHYMRVSFFSGWPFSRAKTA